MRRWMFPEIPDALWNKHKVRFWVVACIDPRFRKRVVKFLEGKLRIRESDYDYQPYPGGAKAFAEATEGDAAESLLKSLEVSRKAHDAEGIILMTHENCAAYGKEFASFREELAFHAEQLLAARRNLKQKCPTMPTRLFFVGREEVREI